MFADIHRQEGGAQIGFYLSGGIRRDIAAGEVTVRNLLDAYPFIDDIVTVKLSGTRLLKVLEQSLSLERGMMQVSGITVRYDLETDPSALVYWESQVGGKALQEDATYSVAVGRFLLNGGDLYTGFLNSEVISVGKRFRGGPSRIISSRVMSSAFR